MQISIDKSDIKGAVTVPSSKSYTIRGLMCAALAEGESELIRPLSSDDTEAGLRVLRQIGVWAGPEKDVWRISGGKFHAPDEHLFCGDSAATLRFMSAICALVPGWCVLTAGPSLAKRPVKILVDALRQWKADITCAGEFAPVAVKGGRLKGGRTTLPGDVSSQYVSALLLIAPMAENETFIQLTTSPESRPYILMTLESLSQFGIQVQYSEDLMEYKTLPQKYLPVRYAIEGDWSSASYLLGLGAAAGEVQALNLNCQSLQGDKALVGFLKEMGVAVTETTTSVTAKKDRLRAIQADLNDCIDLLPTMAVLAALAEGTSQFTGIRRARWKESNRVSAVREGLEAAGISVMEEEDKLTIAGGMPWEAVIDSKNDHRLAMAFSLMGAAAGGITIEGAECVSKTYPEFWHTLRGLGVKLNER
jgi:3-phosphoshikimate 1-carboxyvinyltransferase